MPTRLELSIAWRYLRGRRGSKVLSFISAIAIGGVVVGVSALIVVTGVMTGLQRDLREKMLIGTPDIRVLNSREREGIRDWQAVLQTVQGQPGVVAAAPFVLTQCLANAGHAYVDGGNLVGLPAESHTGEVTDVRSHAKMGDFGFESSDGMHRGVVLGKLIAGTLNVFVGDTVSVGCLGNDQTVPITKRFQVTGVFETGMFQYDGAYMYAALSVAQELAGLEPGVVSGIEVRTSDRSQAEVVAKRLSIRIGPRYQTVDWQKQNKSLFQALTLEKLGMSCILSLIVLVAAFNIVSNLTMVVAAKTREIGILKAMGMTSASVRRVFLTQGLAIGIAGTLVGAVLGVLVSLALDHYQLIRLSAETYSIDHVPVTMQSVDIMAIITASIAIAGLATLYPSNQAARLVPIEAIRGD